MAVKTYNLTKIFKGVAHRPIEKSSGLPLYGLVSKDTSDPEVSGLQSATGIWADKVQRNYNSPTNVRYLALSLNKCLVTYYKPPVTESTSTKTSVSFSAFKTDEFNENIALKAVLSNIRGQESGEDTIKITGNMGSCIHNPWVMSNIEELVLDSSCLFSEAVLNKFSANNKIAIAQIARSGSDKLRTKSNAIIPILIGREQSSLDEIANQFQRLKRITVVKNVSNSVDNWNSEGKEKFTDFFVNNSGGAIILQVEFPAAKKIDTGNLATRPGIYRFDKEILSVYARKFGDELSSQRELDRKQIEQAKAEYEEAHKSDFEKKLDLLYEKAGEEIAFESLYLTYAGLSKEDKQFLQSLLSTEGKKKYSGVIGG
jgi:hypothetical protein